MAAINTGSSPREIAATLSDNIPQSTGQISHHKKFIAHIQKIEGDLENLDKTRHESDSDGSNKILKSIEEELDKIKAISGKELETSSLQEIFPSLFSLLPKMEYLPRDTMFSEVKAVKIVEIMKSLLTANLEKIPVNLLSYFVEAVNFLPSRYPEEKNFKKTSIDTVTQMLNFVIKSTSSRQKTLYPNDCKELQNICKQAHDILLTAIRATTLPREYDDSLSQLPTGHQSLLENYLKISVGIVGRTMGYLTIPPHTNEGKALKSTYDEFNKTLLDRCIRTAPNKIVSKTTLDQIGKTQARLKTRDPAFQVFDALFPYAPLYPHDGISEENSTASKIMSLFGK